MVASAHSGYYYPAIADQAQLAIYTGNTAKEIDSPKIVVC
jgi:hypothetical protein